MIRSYLSTLVFFIFLGLVSLSFPSISNGQSSDLLFVLDCSGSMWGRVDSEPKIVVAKKVLKDLLANIPENINIGLLAYGHRKKGDCNDISMVADIGSDRNQLLKKMALLNPRGMTPISKALEKGVEIISQSDTQSQIILISDGKETCAGNPCDLIKSAIESGVKIVVHVIGFKVTSKTAKQLECIAKEGNGGFFLADNTKELQEALGTLKESIVKEEPLPEPPKVEEINTSQSKSKKLKLPGPGIVTLKPASWVTMPPRYWALIDAETGEVASQSSETSVRIKPGEYQLLWRQTEHGHTDTSLTATVTVKSGDKIDLPVDTGIRITLPEGMRNPKWWGLEDPQDNKLIAKFSGKQLVQVVPAGIYNIVWRQKEHSAATVLLGKIDILPGKLNDFKADMGINFQPADWFAKSIYYTALIDDKGKRIGLWRDLSAQLAPPGEYMLVIRPTEHHHNEIQWGKITIPEHGFYDVPINSGIKFIHGAGAKPPYGIFFINLDTNYEISMKQTWDTQALPPGRYRLDWWEKQHKSKRQTLVDEFQIEAQTLLELEM